MTQTIDFKTIDFKIGGEQTLHCAGCEQRVIRALRAMPGVQHVQASAQTQAVRVELDPIQMSPERVQTKLQQLGYAVIPQGASS